MMRCAAGSQDDVVAFLADPASYGGTVESVARHDTHGAMIFLAGEEAWKIKRAVRFPYMDFSTLAKRRAACEREIEINRVWAPEIYLGCVPITRSPAGELQFDGDGEIVEWAVRMRRFDQRDLMSSIARERGIDRDLAVGLADTVFASHQSAETVRGTAGADSMTALVCSVSRTLASLRALLPIDQTGKFRDRAEERLTAVRGVLDARAQLGYVRRCHGDLHLDNVVMWRGRPVLFDAIEFDEDIARIDTLYDLSFLLMDLCHNGLKPAANTVLNRYLWRSGETFDLDGLAALPLFLGLRAAIRAMVAAERAEQQEIAKTDQHAASAGSKRGLARRYMEEALGYLAPLPPELIAVAGLSGTGKSTLAASLAPAIGPLPGAIHLRSDLERKRLFGVQEFERLGPEAYTPEATARVYDSLRDKARHALAAGHAVIVDAVCARAEERASLEALGESVRVPFRGLWLTAKPATLKDRVSARRNDASDATVDVVDKQLGYDIGALSKRWSVVDAGDDPEMTAHHARLALSRR